MRRFVVVFLVLLPGDVAPLNRASGGRKPPVESSRIINRGFALVDPSARIINRGLTPPARPDLDAKTIDAIVTKSMKTWQVPGCAVAIVHEGKVIHLKGYGVREIDKKERVTPDTLFALGSSSKAFTTAALAILADEGKIHWDDKVSKHLPWFRLADPLASDNVTLRDLLCHRTGLGAHELLWDAAPWTPEDAVKRAGNLPLDHGFRTTFRYQSTMYTAAGLAAAAANKTTWPELIQNRLLTPLGLSSTVLSLTEARKSKNRAKGHVEEVNGVVQAHEAQSMLRPDAAGSIYTSARDAATWMRFQLTGKNGNKQLVTLANLGETHKGQMPIRLDDLQWSLFPDTVQQSYGFAWVVYDRKGHRLIAHGGALDGQRAHFTLLPSKNMGFVVLSNLHQTPFNQIVVNHLLDRIIDLKKYDWDALHQKAMEQRNKAEETAQKTRLANRVPGTKPSKELSAYGGDYEHPAYGIVQIRLVRGVLVWKWNNTSAPLSHFHYNTFSLAVAPVGHADVTFALDRFGKVDRFAVTGRLNVVFRRQVVKPR